MIRTTLVVLTAAAALAAPAPAQAVGTGPLMPVVPRGSSVVCVRTMTLVPLAWSCEARSRKTRAVTARSAAYADLWRFRGWRCNDRRPARVFVCWKP